MKWVAVALGAWMVGVLAHRYLPPADVEWATQVFEKKRLLIDENQDVGRVLIIGGSGTYFGVDSNIVEAALNRPALNLGVHAGLGISVLATVYADQIAAGDTVVLIPEYHGLSNPTATGSLEYGFRAGTTRLHLPLEAPSRTAHSALSFGRPGIRPLLRGAALHLLRYRGADPYATELDSRGNMIHFPPDENEVRPGRCEPASEDSLAAVRWLAAKTQEEGGRFFVALPWFQVDTFDNAAPGCRSVRDQLSTEFEVLENRDDLNLHAEVQFFSDTPYHLSSLGRAARSAELAGQLVDALGVDANHE